MTERITEAELAAIEAHLAPGIKLGMEHLASPVSGRGVAKLVAEVRRLRGLIEGSWIDNDCEDCTTRLADGLDALEAEARAIRGEGLT